MEQIRDGLYVGDLQDAAGLSDTDRNIQSFDHVITLSDRVTDATTEHYALSNWGDNDGLFEEAVDSIREYLRDGDEIFTHCTVGVSRSGAVVATAVAAEENREFDAVLEEIEEAMPQVSPHPALVTQARDYLGEETTTSGIFDS